ncbi:MULTISPECIES: F0F1 ATP synthase subunit B [Bacillaceae]|nr:MULTISPECIES: F0F1 ATP synthase subunit B [Bacillaceae]
MEALFGETFTFGDAIFQILGFLVLMWLLKRYALGPVMDMMEKRENHIAEQISSAEKNRQDAEKYLEEQREAIQQARLEAKEIVENTRRMSEQQAEELKAEAKREADRRIEAAIAQINQEKEQAISALREQVSTLSILVASKVIERELDEQEQEKLIQETLKEVGEEL